MGAIVKQLHDCQIIHNDLTTSNFIYAQAQNKMYVIDFGLAQIGFPNDENKAVDLYVLEKSIIALTGDTTLFAHVLEGYAPDKKLVSRLDEVRKRGRKK